MLAYGVFEEEEYGGDGAAAKREVDPSWKVSLGVRISFPEGSTYQKHQRHVRRSVNAPPRIGPMTEDMPNILDSIPM